MPREGGRVLQKLRHLWRRDLNKSLPDAQLLDGFVSRGDEAAFAALVTRHGPMVLGVCQRVLGNSHDAADAFQGSFLVLARRAAAIRKPEAVSSWLYGVAYRVATRMKSSASRRRLREQELPAPGLETPPDLSWRELLAGLDEELHRLPEKNRQPVILCFLEGLSQEEAAAHLGCKRSTLKRRLDRGRELLRRRLIRRGLTLGVAAIATLSAAKALAMPVAAGFGKSLAAAAVCFAVRKPLPPGLVSPSNVALAESVIKTMVLAKLKLLSTLFLVTLSVAGAWLYLYSELGNRRGTTPQPVVVVVQRNSPSIGGKWLKPAPQPATGAKVLDRLVADDYVKSVVFTPDGNTLLCGTASSAGPPHGHVRRRDVVKRRKKGWELSSTHGVNAIAVSSNGELIAMSTAGTRIGGFQVQPGELKLFDATTGMPKAILKSQAHSFSSIAFSPEGKTLVGGSPNWDIGGRPVEGGLIWMWDVASGKPIGTLKGHRGLIRSVAFSPVGKLLASASFDIPPARQAPALGEVKLWDLATGKEKISLKGVSLPVWCVAFNPSGKVLACGGEDHAIHLWDTATGEQLTPLEGNKGNIYALAFSPDGATLASGGGDLSHHPSPGEVRLWDVANRKETAVLGEHEVTVTSLAFNRDGTQLATGGHDGKLVVWEVTK
jgi:RNA polymerase sigma factor (sigma-70 family)